MATSDAESDHYGAFDLSFSQFTADDFAEIDTNIASHFEPHHPPDPEPIEHTTANSSLDFDASLDLFNLTEEDFLEIDNAVALQIDVATPTPEPPAPIEVEAPKPGPSTKPAVKLPYVGWKYKGKWKPWEERSLMEKFRPSGVLSVSDLVGPVWCEVQFDYGLRQKRSRPVANRPKSFKTSTGKEIVVETKVAEKNDVVTKQGQAVHKELEREVRAEEVKIDVRTDEERWGLRLLNMIASFQILINEGMIREVPVFGMVNGAVIVGIIDEISRTDKKRDLPKRTRASRSPRKGSKRQKRTPSPHQADIEDYFIPSPRKGTAKSSEKRKEGRFSLLLRDTKTRVKDAMPPEEDTNGSRLQVMLYHRLLSELISTEKSFDFVALWDRLGIDSQVEFSTGFLVQAGLLDHNNGFSVINLDGLVDSWKRTLEASSIVDIDPNLQLVYRLQPRPSDNSNGKGKERASFAPNESQLYNAEARFIATQIRNSLLNGQEGLAEGPSKAGGQQEEQELDLELQKVLYQSLVPQLPGVEEPPAEEPVETDIHGYKIIGRKNFVYDDVMLKNHLQSVFEFWRCERNPVGVPLQLARRCNTCEYQNGCEWREEKAAELSSRRTSLEGGATANPNKD
ncbi:hypothetical protein H1R20_g15740, partial [Candolleomyces eurysporus]